VPSFAKGCSSLASVSSKKTRRRAASVWLDDARADLANARSLSRHRDEDTAPFAAAFHAQQAVEKGLKSLLIWYGLDYPAKHDLSLLLGLLPAQTAAAHLPVAGLTVYAVEQRYVTGAANPMSLDERPTWEDAEEAISAAERAVMAITADLAEAFRQGKSRF